MLAERSNHETADIVLATLNARYIHSAFGLRYLKANLGPFEEHCEIQEFTLESRADDIVEQILASSPKVVGFGVYIWNSVPTEKVVALLKTVAPDVIVVLGGPEVSYEHADQPIVGLSDYVITGWGEVSFRELMSTIFTGDMQKCDPASASAAAKVIKGEQPKLDQIQMPYQLYNSDDIKNRLLYVEASRGCPFKCEFCLSALDKTAWPFDLDLFLTQMDELHQRGARHFKFVDRTFNLKIKNSLRILQFFLDRMSDDLFLHFEVVPDHLPEALKEMIVKFPEGALQFEIGIQTFNPEVQTRISRRQNNEKAKDNLTWIRDHSQAYIHADLIFGLPGESMESFAASFDQLVGLRPHEIQVGILKRLKGSPIIRHTDAHQLRFNPNPPFSILASDTVNFTDVQFMGRFARYWDMIGNSGRFKSTLPLLLNKELLNKELLDEELLDEELLGVDSPFKRFSVIAKEIFERSGQTHKISLLRLFDLVFDIATQTLSVDADKAHSVINDDYLRSGLKSRPKCLQLSQKSPPNTPKVLKSKRKNASRQARHD